MLDTPNGASKLIDFLESFAKKLKDESGEITFIMTQTEIERAYAETELFAEFEKGKQSVREGKTHTRADFRGKYGLAE